MILLYKYGIILTSDVRFESNSKKGGLLKGLFLKTYLSDELYIYIEMSIKKLNKLYYQDR